jgi:hypothetical protein
MNEEDDAPCPEVIAARRRLRALSFTEIAGLSAAADDSGDMGQCFGARREIRRRKQAVNVALLRVRPERHRGHS